jgi:multidrug efflux pump subunit AcrB
MSLAGAALKNRTVTYFASALLVIGGIASYFNLAQLEDPEFTVKTAVVAPPYPGASPLAVTIMAGLAFGTILTMVVIPVLYCILFRIKSPQASG